MQKNRLLWEIAQYLMRQVSLWNWAVRRVMMEDSPNTSLWKSTTAILKSFGTMLQIRTQTSTWEIWLRLVQDFEWLCTRRILRDSRLHSMSIIWSWESRRNMQVTYFFSSVLQMQQHSVNAFQKKGCKKVGGKINIAKVDLVCWNIRCRLHEK